jgi:hypothetical protein
LQGYLAHDSRHLHHLLEQELLLLLEQEWYQKERLLHLQLVQEKQHEAQTTCEDRQWHYPNLLA